jgi:hypothetical protein
MWIGALCGVAFGWRAGDRTVAALAVVAAAWALPTVAGTALGYRRCPATSSCPRPSAACSPGSGPSPSRVWRPVRGAALRWRRPGRRQRPVCRLTRHRAGPPGGRCKAGPRSSRHSGAPWTKPNGELRSRACTQSSSRARWRTAWPGKLDLRLHDVVGAFSPTARIAFIEGDDRAVIARRRRRDATAVRLTAAGPWRVLMVRRGAKPLTRWTRPPTAPHLRFNDTARRSSAKGPGERERAAAGIA